MSQFPGKYGVLSAYRFYHTPYGTSNIVHSNDDNQAGMDGQKPFIVLSEHLMCVPVEGYLLLGTEYGVHARTATSIRRNKPWLWVSDRSTGELEQREDEGEDEDVQGLDLINTPYIFR